MQVLFRYIEKTIKIQKNFVISKKLWVTGQNFPIIRVYPEKMLYKIRL